MHTGPCTIFLAVALAPVLLAQAASAQTAAPVTTAAPAAAVCNCPTSTVPPQHVQPYTLKQETTHTQTLLNGTIIKSVEETVMIRDAEGRLRNETTRTQNGEVVHLFSIFDYVTQTRYVWNIGDDYPQIVQVFHFQQNRQPVAPPVPASPRPAMRYIPQATRTLPPQTIAGVYATGFLRKTTTPAGYEGNNRDIVVTDEIWNAPDIGNMPVRRILDDPRTGKTITETTELQLAAPDPALFEAPEGYEIRDTTPAPAPSATPAACNCTTPVAQQHFRPYIATQRTTNVKTQTDGTTTTTITQTHIWRDAEGRTRLENFGTLPDGTTSFGDTNVYDPVERVRMSWSIGNSNAPNVVTIRHFPQPAYQPAQAAPVNPQSDRRYFPQRTETLPPQTIDGFYATGTSTTRTIPAGYEGNDRDITTTQDHWYSPDLGIQLRYITNDPRNGKATTEVTDIQQIAPDPALFKAPEGYQVKDANP